jgi:hypothetical protein
MPWKNWLGDTDREQLSTRWRPIFMKNKTIHALWIATACLFLLIGVVGYFGLMIPMEKRQITKQVQRLVREIGAVIEARSVVMGAATNTLRKSDLLSMTSSEHIYNTLRSRFSDFRRLDVIDGNGEILGMVGDLPVSKTGLEMRTQVSSFSSLKSRMTGDKALFRDDQKSGCFFITRKFIHEKHGDMFIRAKFIRRPISSILASVSQNSSRKAYLDRVSGGQSVIARDKGTGKEVPQVRIDGSWWTGPIAAEIVFLRKGWAVSLKGRPGAAHYIPIALACVSLIALGLLVAPLVPDRPWAAKAAAILSRSYQTRHHENTVSEISEPGPLPEESIRPGTDQDRLMEIRSDLEEFLDEIPCGEVLYHGDGSNNPPPSANSVEEGLIESHSEEVNADPTDPSFATAFSSLEEDPIVAGETDSVSQTSPSSLLDPMSSPSAESAENEPIVGPGKTAPGP